MISFRNCTLAMMILACTIYSAQLFASSRVTQSLRPKPWKITEQQFLDQYGKDDTSRALIRYYFERRKTSKRASFWFSGGAGVFGLIAQTVAGNPGGRDPDNLNGALLFLFAGLFLFGIVAVIAIVKWISRTRKYLFKLIKRYNGRKGIPKRITTQELFQKLLKEEYAK